MNKVTLKDISARVGVSVSTISNVLNGRGNVSDETARLVRSVVAELGYQHKPTAPKGTSKRSETLGLVVANLGYLFAEAIAGAEAVLARFGYHLLLCNSDKGEGRQPALVDVLTKRKVDGIIFIDSSAYRSHDAVRQLAARRIPFAVVNRLTDPNLGLHILIENQEGAYQATRHLAELGHREVAMIHLPTSGRTATEAAKERVKGFVQAVHDFGLNGGADRMRQGVHEREPGLAVAYAAMCDLLDQPVPPTGVICGNDYLALGAMRAVTERGLRIPQDVAIVGYDDSPIAAFTSPSLTTVRQPMHAAGARAAEALLQHFWKGAPLTGVERLSCELVVRGSTVPYQR